MKINKFILSFIVASFIFPVLEVIFSRGWPWDSESVAGFLFLSVITFLSIPWPLIYFWENLENLFNPILLGIGVGVCWMPLSFATLIIVGRLENGLMADEATWIITFVLTIIVLILEIYLLLSMLICVAEKFITYQKNKQTTE